MQTRTKVFSGLLLGGALYAWLKPKVFIKTLALDGVNKIVSYEMKFHNYEMKDTFVMGDIPNFVPVGDGKHYYAAWGNPLTGIVNLAIGYYDSTGGFYSVKTLVVSFAEGIAT